MDEPTLTSIDVKINKIIEMLSSSPSSSPSPSSSSSPGFLTSMTNMLPKLGKTESDANASTSILPKFSGGRSKKRKRSKRSRTRRR